MEAPTESTPAPPSSTPNAGSPSFTPLLPPDPVSVGPLSESQFLRVMQQQQQQMLNVQQQLATIQADTALLPGIQANTSATRRNVEVLLDLSSDDFTALADEITASQAKRLEELEQDK